MYKTTNNLAIKHVKNNVDLVFVCFKCFPQWELIYLVTEDGTTNFYCSKSENDDNPIGSPIILLNFVPTLIEEAEWDPADIEGNVQDIHHVAAMQ